MERAPRLPSLDALRGLAALAVVVFHANSTYWRDGLTVWDGQWSALWAVGPLRVLSQLAFGFGFLGVLLFFVLSGVVIHLPQAYGRVPQWPAFARRRALRIYPAYLVVVLGLLILEGIRSGFGVFPSTIRYGLEHLAFWYFDVPPGRDTMGITAVLWTVALEVQFYAMYALAFRAFSRVGWWRVAVIGLAIDVAYRIAWWHGWLGIGVDWPAALAPTRFALTRFGEWAVGAALADSFARGTLASSRWLAPAALTCAVAVLVIAITAGADRYVLDVPFVLVCAGLVAWAMTQPRTVSPWLLRLGACSYSLYLIHFTVIELTISRFGPHWIGALVGVGLSLALAWALYVVVERPCLALRRPRPVAWPVPAATLPT